MHANLAVHVLTNYIKDM